MAGRFSRQQTEGTLSAAIQNPTGLVDLISFEAVEKAVMDSIPRGTEELNMKALERGYAFAQDLVGAVSAH